MKTLLFTIILSLGISCSLFDSSKGHKTGTKTFKQNLSLNTPRDVTPGSEKIIDYAEKLVTRQVGNYTCWAAVQEGIMKYHGKRVSQYEVVKGFWISMGYKLDQDLFEKAKDQQEMAIPSYYVSNAVSVEAEISRGSIEKIIDQNRPVLASANNHESIIVGYTKDHYFVADPLVGKIIKQRKDSYFYLYRNGTELAQFFSIEGRKTNKNLAAN